MRRLLIKLNAFLPVISRGQAMVEYTLLTAVLVTALVITTPIFSTMIDALMTYLDGIMYVLNFPLP